jgi:hypothetical protein
VLADCDNNVSQKFYLQVYSDQDPAGHDFVPQTHGAAGQASPPLVRILAVSFFDARAGLDPYALLRVDATGALSTPRVEGTAITDSPWHVVKTTADSGDGSNWAKVAEQNGRFTITGYEPRKARYVTGQQVVETTLTMNPLLGGNVFTCTRASCYVQAASSTDTPLRVSISTITGSQCIVSNPDGASLSMGSCTAQGSGNAYTPANAAWTLRPTRYPSGELEDPDEPFQ